MKLHNASKKEILRIAAGAAICFALMETVFFVLSLLGVGRFHYTVVLGGLIGTLIAIGNFTVLCLTIQSAAQVADQKQMKSRFQLSYHIRLMVQSGWVVAAFLLPWFHAVAAAVPLLFPTMIIYFLQSRRLLADRKEKQS